MDLSLDNDTDCDSIAPLGFGREIGGSGVALRRPANADVGFAASGARIRRLFHSAILRRRESLL